MKTKGVINIRLPRDLLKEIEEDARREYLTKSGWFEKVVRAYFEEIAKKKATSTKQIIDLDI
ncbi:MAG: hypothetical protein ABFQ95_06505 [Pseudomonadota bacterium]